MSLTVLVLELPPRARRIPLQDQVGILEAGTTSACAENTPRDEFDRVGVGTTSACAENTHRPSRGGKGNRNYLRVRGEYVSKHLGWLKDLELPPRARRIRFARIR